MDGLITVSSTDTSNSCNYLVYLYVHTQVVQENFDTVLQTQYYKDVDKFYKEVTGKKECFLMSVNLVIDTNQLINI